MRAIALSLTLSFLAGVNGHAEEAIATATAAPTGGAPAISAGSTAPLSISDLRHFDDRGPAQGPWGGVPKVADDGSTKADKHPHGEVHAGIGTHGYREIGGVACMPLGDNGAVIVAIDAGRYPGGHR